MPSWSNGSYCFSCRRATMLTRMLSIAPPPDALSSEWLLLLLAPVCDMFARKLSVAPPSDACRPHCCCCFSCGGADLDRKERDEILRVLQKCAAEISSPLEGRATEVLCREALGLPQEHARVDSHRCIALRLIATSGCRQSCWHYLQHDRGCFFAASFPGRLQLACGNGGVGMTSDMLAYVSSLRCSQ